MTVWSFWESSWPLIVLIVSAVIVIAWPRPDETTYHRLEREVGELRARQRAEEGGGTMFGGILNTSETPTYTALSGTAGGAPTLTLSALRRLWNSINDSHPPTRTTGVSDTPGNLDIAVDALRRGSAVTIPNGLRVDPSYERLQTNFTTSTETSVVWGGFFYRVNNDSLTVEWTDMQGDSRTEQIPTERVEFFTRTNSGTLFGIPRNVVEDLLGHRAHPSGSGGASGVANYRGTYTTQTGLSNVFYGGSVVETGIFHDFDEEDSGGLENPIVYEESPSNPLPAIPALRIDGQLIYNAPHRHGILSGGSDTVRLDRAFEAFERSVNSTFDGLRAQMGLPPIDDQPTIMTTDGRHREDDDEFSMEAWLKDGQELLTDEPPVDKQNPA